MNITNIKDIPINIHKSTMVLALGFLTYWGLSHGFTAGLGMAFIIVFLMVVVVAHELGHSIVAMAYGHKVEEILLLPFGGLARINCNKNIEGTEEEFWISAAGPAVNFMIAGMLVPFAALNVPYSFYFVVLNVLMGVFNVIPAYPMDGGRMLRDILAKFTSIEKAKKITISVSYGISLLFIYFGIKYDIIMLPAIGLFLIWACRQEKKHCEKKKRDKNT